MTLRSCSALSVNGLPWLEGVTTLRILHAPVDIAGQATLSANGLRQIGYQSEVFSAPNPFKYALQPDLFLKSTSGWGQRLELMIALARFAVRYDVFHYHFGRSMLPERFHYLDARALRHLGKRIVIEFWGSDIRIPSIERERNPYFVNSYNEKDKVNIERLQRWSEITNGHVIISDHYFDLFLRPYFQHIHVVRQRVNLERYTPVYPDPDVTVPVVVHAPSQQAFKGTEYVRQAVERLKERGFNFRYVEVTGTNHEDAIPIYATADLVIDQVCAGAHGVLAVEAMALGKPVVCYVMPELIQTYPEGFPIINANPETLEAVLAEWLQRPEDRHTVGIESRAYAERVHDHRRVASRLAEVYKNL